METGGRAVAACLHRRKSSVMKALCTVSPPGNRAARKWHRRLAAQPWKRVRPCARVRMPAILGTDSAARMLREVPRGSAHLGRRGVPLARSHRSASALARCHRAPQAQDCGLWDVGPASPPSWPTSPTCETGSMPDGRWAWSKPSEGWPVARRCGQPFPTLRRQADPGLRHRVDSARIGRRRSWLVGAVNDARGAGKPTGAHPEARRDASAL